MMMMRKKKFHSLTSQAAVFSSPSTRNPSESKFSLLLCCATFNIIMSLFWNSIDGVHLERVNAEQMAKRGIFVNVKPVNDNRNGGELGYNQALGGSGFFHLENENNLNSSSPTRKRDAFTKTPIKKVFQCWRAAAEIEKTFAATSTPLKWSWNIYSTSSSSVRYMQIIFFTYFRIKFSIVCYRSIISYVPLAHSLTRDEVNRENFNFSFNQERWHIHFVLLWF